MRTYLFKAFLFVVVFAAAGPAQAEVVVQPAYNPCDYARNLIKDPNAFYVGGIAGVNWLEAAICQATAEDCWDIGNLCGSGVGYEELDQLCSPGNELRICVPKASPGDKSGVCVAFTNGCPSQAEVCEKAGCSFDGWSPKFPPVPDTGGGPVRFMGGVYERPVACTYEPYDDGSPACQGDPQIQIPPPPPTEHPCDEYDAGSKEWWCCMDPLSSECLPGDLTPTGGSTGGTTTGGTTGGTGGSGTGGSGTTGGETTGGATGGGTGCCNCCDGCDPDEPAVPEEPSPNPPEPSENAGSEFLCKVTALDTEKAGGKLFAVTKEGTGISLLIEHIASAGLEGASTVELTQTAGPGVTMTDPQNVPFAAHTSWTVQLGTPDKMVGEYIPNASFLVTVYGENGQVLRQTSCEEKAGLHTQGGSGGCSFLPYGSVPSGPNALLLILLLSSFGIGLVRCRRN